MTRKRLDAELVRRGLVGSADEAAELIGTGRVTVAGHAEVKPETLVSASEPVAVKSEERRYASRGGEKLAAALDAFEVDPSGKVCLDAESSTGGFTDVLLARGAARVVAVDVGYGLLAWHLRTDQRVTVMERTNARDLRSDDLPARPAIVTADLSFISLATVIPALVAIAERDADMVLLVKPQFEADRSEVARGGVVGNVDVWRRVIESVAEASRSAGAGVLGSMASPLPGPAGNVEFFLHARVGARDSEVGLDEALRAGAVLRRVKGEAS